MTELSIDIDACTVSFVDRGSYRVLQGQWTVFYLALSLRAHASGPASRFLDSHELQGLGPWFLKKPDSVGKEIARHLQFLSTLGLGHVIVHNGRTKRWRLGLSKEAVTFLPSLERCESWMRQQQWDILGGIDQIPGMVIPWLKLTTQALIRLQQGRIEEGLASIREAKKSHAGSILLAAIAELVELRLCARIGQYPDPGKHLNQCEGNIGKTLLIRASLAQALAPDFENLDLAIESLRKLTLRLETLPDINGLGTAYNALGVLFRRRRQLDMAERCLRYAAALLVASFDLPTLQAALFNLGHVYYQRAASRSDLEDALHLIELDREICRSLGLGKDSAQAESVGGAICLSLGKVREANLWLEEGKKIVATLSSDYSRAEIELLAARIQWVRSWAENSPIPQLRKRAILRSYEEVQRLTSMAGFPTSGIDQEIATLRRDEAPTWSR